MFPSDKHEFALFYKNINKSTPIKIIIDKKNDLDIFRRIMSILRLSVDDILVLFGFDYHVRVQIVGITKKQIICNTIQGPIQNISFTPYIVYGLPLLKRSQLESALYSLAELGVQEIQLLKTSKIYPSIFNKERLEKVLISACEQSKNYKIPILHEPLDLESWISSLDSKEYGLGKVMFDAQGCSSFDIACNIRKILCESIQSHTYKLAMLSGPEGDLTIEEKKLVLSEGFTLCRLTPTILRAQQAVAVGVGFIRSLVYLN